MTTRRLLLIQRDGSIRRALARALENEGFEVRVTDEAGARDAVESYRPAAVVYDAELLDSLAWIKRSEAGGSFGDQGNTTRFVSCARPVNMEELRHALRVG